MDKSMKKFMDVGIVYFMAYPETIKGEGPILETMKKIAIDDYFDAIEVGQIKDPSIRTQAATLLAGSKLQVRYGAQPRLLTTGLNPNALEESDRLAAEATLLEAFEEAEELGSPGIAFLSGKYEEATKEESYAQLVRTTKNLCKRGKEKGMSVILEIFDYDIDKAALIGPTVLAKRFADEITAEYDNFGLMVDLSHIPMYYESFTQSLDPIKEYIVHLHVGNTVIKDPSLPGYGDQHVRFGFPESENDTAELRDFLEHCIKVGILQEGKPKVVSFEVKPFGDEDSDVLIASAKRTLNRAWNAIEL